MDSHESKIRRNLVTLATAAAGEIIAEILGERFDKGARSFQYVGPAYIGLVVTPEGIRTDLYDQHNGPGAAARALEAASGPATERPIETADTEPPPPPKKTAKKKT